MVLKGNKGDSSHPSHSKAIKVTLPPALPLDLRSPSLTLSCPSSQAVVLGQDFAVTASEDGSIKVPAPPKQRSIVTICHTSLLDVEHKRKVQERRRTFGQIHVRPLDWTPPPPFHKIRLVLRLFIRFCEDGNRSPYTLSHLSVDGRFLVTWGPQRGLQLLDLQLRAVAFSVPAVHTGPLEAVLCGAQSPTTAGATLPRARFCTWPHFSTQALCHFKS